MTASLAMLLQDRADPALTAEALAAQMRADWPDLDTELLRAEPRDFDMPDGPLSIDYGDVSILLMPIAAPIGDDIAQIAAHSRLWPNAEPAPEDYAAHTIVTVMEFPAEGTAPTLDALGRAVLLSRVLASATALLDTVRAVYFGSANHIVLPALFRELAMAQLPEPMPLAWVAFNIGARPDGTMTGHTLGMDMLGLMDIEIPETDDSAENVFDRLTGICAYLLEHGPVIEDGDTLGESADERIVVAHAPSAYGDGRQVLQLRSEPTRH
ncbi:DUF4261 domain-containing protein [Luteimonas sp. S4-F44]|uniref:DUF4261 domain-containing protein n=1 Tax=Luteimonas sp. S4-F44 TaxID=2925842 RepID=UPI001F53AB53|nr:DUF4261 domain-containing protein [Luteimonas sp. S4-F44]UNK42678.1 DUF4261 domain-containing protein [Luteimonas sp. S4-F44]